MIAIQVVNAPQWAAALTNEENHFIGKSILYHLFMIITQPDTVFDRKLVSNDLEYRSKLALFLADNLYSPQTPSGGILNNGCFIPVGTTPSTRALYGSGRVLAYIDSSEYESIRDYCGKAFIAPLTMLNICIRDIHHVITSTIRQCTWDSVSEYEMLKAINALGLMDAGPDNVIVDGIKKYVGRGINIANQPIHLRDDGSLPVRIIIKPHLHRLADSVVQRLDALLKAALTDAGFEVADIAVEDETRSHRTVPVTKPKWTRVEPIVVQPTDGNINHYVVRLYSYYGVYQQFMAISNDPDCRFIVGGNHLAAINRPHGYRLYLRSLFDNNIPLSLIDGSELRSLVSSIVNSKCRLVMGVRTDVGIVQCIDFDLLNSDVSPVDMVQRVNARLLEYIRNDLLDTKNSTLRLYWVLVQPDVVYTNSIGAVQLLMQGEFLEG